MTQPQKNHLNKARGKAALARELVGRGAGDLAALDAAAGEAYYAMFHTAHAFLSGHVPEDAKHGTIIGRFGQLYAKTGLIPVDFHRYIIDAQDVRNMGDYNSAGHVGFTDAEKLVRQAEEFLDFADKNLDAVYVALNP